MSSFDSGLVLSAGRTQPRRFDLDQWALAIGDLRTHQVPRTMALNLAPERMVIGPDGYRVGIGNARQDVVAVVSTLDYREMARVGEFVEPTRPAFGFDGSQLYVTDSATNRLALIDMFVGENDPVWLDPMLETRARLESIGIDVFFRSLPKNGHFLPDLSFENSGRISDRVGGG